MARRVEALVNAKLLIWARESAGLSAEQAAKKAQVKLERLQSWETGQAKPTVAQLRKLARIYRRPLAVFYLSEVPRAFTPLRDFRRFPGDRAATASPELVQEIRRAHERRQVALELYEALGDVPPAFEVSVGVIEDAEATAVHLRALLGIAHEEQTNWSSPYEALNRWRSALEGLGVLVFQISRVEPGEARAFSIGEFPLPVIAVNAKEAPVARVFSMLHEFAHIALRQAGICDLEESARGRGVEEARTEVICNRIAGAMLVPAEQLLSEPMVLSAAGRVEWTDEEISYLARRYRVSREAILRRLLIVGRTTRDFYRQKREEIEQRPHQERGGGIVLPHVSAVSKSGPLFVRLVLNSYYQEKITANDLADMLDVRLKHLHSIERSVFGRMAPSGAVA